MTPYRPGTVPKSSPMTSWMKLKEDLSFSEYSFQAGWSFRLPPVKFLEVDSPYSCVERRWRERGLLRLPSSSGALNSTRRSSLARIEPISVSRQWITKLSLIVDWAENRLGERAHSRNSPKDRGSDEIRLAYWKTMSLVWLSRGSALRQRPRLSGGFDVGFVCAFP